MPLKEADTLPGTIARAGDADIFQRPFVKRRFDALEIEVLRQQLAQRCIVEQRARRAANQPPPHQRGQPARTRQRNTQGIGAVNLMGMKIGPDGVQAIDGQPKIFGHGGQGCGIDGPGRSTAPESEKGFSGHPAICRGWPPAPRPDRRRVRRRQSEAGARSGCIHRRSISRYGAGLPPGQTAAPSH